ncbi:MAG: glycosyltransferase family 4 protein [Acidothermales bacterium]|nr:glycosyltransferase family 4 protein [Acidothermales bacterium]
MRIAQVATLATPVAPGRAGSVEGLVWLLARELTSLGHEVTVFGAGGSDAQPAALVETVPAPYTWERGPEDWQLAEWVNVCRSVERSREFDVIHTHAYLWGLPLAPLSVAPLVGTTHVMPSADTAALRSAYPEVQVTAISKYQWSHYADLPSVPVVAHGLDPLVLRPADHPEDYLLWLGRFTPDKGPLDAIEVARHTGRRLLLAGPLNAYYKQVVAPHVDDDRVVYAGYVGGEGKADLLANAAALLYPVRSPEPFGLVLVEAMLCGTPAAALRLGAVPEVVDEGITGMTADALEGLAELVEPVVRLPRGSVRARAVERFAAGRMARDYLSVYETAAR